MNRAAPVTLMAIAWAACGGPQPPAASSSGPATTAQPPFEAPVATNAEPPVRYPADAFQQNLEGTVILRLFVDSLGRLRPESTRVAEGSGVPALDSAAKAGVPAMRFAPARRNGRAVSTAFLQPVHFRRPERALSQPQP
ncbi:MAG: energy transducer TonB [Gemmatimonadetes bacterium]|nr:energy transducer TonB [Gemmatimonadota bacterium]